MLVLLARPLPRSFKSMVNASPSPPPYMMHSRTPLLGDREDILDGFQAGWEEMASETLATRIGVGSTTLTEAVES